jgi:phage terminase Nu1 subunit (DNA packaging protein)
VIDKKERKPTTGGVLIGSSYDEARTRKINAEAEIAELELARIRQTLCKTEDVVKAWESVLHACRAKFLAMPSKMAPVLANVTDTAVIKDHLENAVREALDELANYQPSVDPVATGTAVQPQEGEAPPKKPVGRPRKISRLKE